MNVEEIFIELENKYGEDFNWVMIAKTNTYFVDELNRELGKDYFRNKIYAIAKCESNDDVLFLVENNQYRIYHLTYTTDNIDGYPKYIAFNGLLDVMNYIENNL